VPAETFANAWEAFGKSIASAHAQLTAAAPDPAVAAEAEAYLMRVATNALSDIFLGHLFAEGGLTRALPTRGGPNPDYIMWFAPIDPTRHYRLEGRLNDSDRAGVGLYSSGVAGANALAGYVAFDRATTGSDGRFFLELGPQAVGPNTLAIPADCRVILVRVLHRVPRGQSCMLTLTGGSGHRGFGPAMGSAEAAFAQAAQGTLRSVQQFLEWSRLTSANPNRITPPPPSLAEEVRSDPDTDYRLGYFDLCDGEWLEATVPAASRGYWSLHAYNHWCESLPGAGVHDLSAVADPDGLIRVRIGPAVPTSLANRVDTLGRRRGVLIFRSIGAATVPPIETAIRRG
jgi:hypothetical protein